MIKLTEKIIVDAVLFCKLQKLQLGFPGVEFMQNEILATTNTVVIIGDNKAYYSKDIVFSDELTIMTVPEWAPGIIAEDFKLKIEYDLCNDVN